MSSTSTTEESSVHVHTFSNDWEYNENGHYHPSTCGHDVTTPIEPHQYSKETIQPDYDHQGYTIYTCDICGYTYNDDYVDPLEHTYADTYSHDETHHWYPCLDKGYEDLKQGYALHDFIEQVIEPTIGEDGYTLHQCKECGYSYKDTYTEYIPASLLEYLHFELNDAEDGYKLIGTYGNPKELDIPLEYEGLPVIEIASGALSNCKTLTKLSLPFIDNSVTILDLFGATSRWDKAVPTSLKTIIVKEGTKALPSYAFFNCVDVETILLPNSLASIGYDAFSYTTSLKANTTNGANYLGNEDNPYILLLNAEDQSLTNFAIPSTCRFVYQSAFYGHQSLVTLSIPSSITSIAQNAFAGCPKLNEINLEENLSRKYGSYSFSEISPTASLAYKGTVEGYLTNGYKLAQYVSTVHLYLDGDTETTNLVIPSTTPTLPKGIFAKCDSIQSLSLPYLFIDIYKQYTLLDLCGDYLPSLTKLTLQEGCDTLPDKAFYGWDKLTQIDLPSSLTYIGTSAFEGCSSLASLDIKGSPSISGDSTFKDCVSLTSLDLRNVTFGSALINPFEGCENLVTLLLPDSLGSYYAEALMKFATIYENGYYFGGKDNPYSHYLCPVDPTVTSLTIHPDTRDYSLAALKECKNLVSLTLPFNGYNTGLTLNKLFTLDSDIAIPETLSTVTVNNGYISHQSFRGATGITKLILLEGVEGASSDLFDESSPSPRIEYHGALDGWMNFVGKSDLGGFVSLYLDGNDTETKDIVVPGTYGRIENYCFYNCYYLKSVTLEHGITSIGNYAFANVRLKDIYIPSTMESVANYAFDNDYPTFHIKPPATASKWAPKWYPAGYPTIIYENWY